MFVCITHTLNVIKTQNKQQICTISKNRLFIPQTNKLQLY